MTMTADRRLLQVVASLLTLAVCSLGLLVSGRAGLAASVPTTSITIQTMDSCQRALGGARYVLSGGGGIDITATTPAHSAQTVASGTCALQQGNCATFTTGCAQFVAVPYPGTYTFRETTTPPGNTSNPEGYAPCNGGSACRSEMGTVSIDAAGVVKGTVVNVYPDNTSVTYPIPSRHSGVTSYAGTPADPIVTHDFGLAPPGYNGASQCDGDSDADDHSTGSPSSHCAYPEGGESSACQPYPWSCSNSTTSTTTSGGSTTTGASTTTTTTTITTTSGGSTTTGTSTTTTTTTTSSASTSTATSTSTTSTSAACPTQATQNFTGSAGAGSSTSEFTHPTAAGRLTATVSWTPLTTVDLIVYNSALAVVGQTSGSTGSLSLTLNLPVDSSYKVKVKNTGSQSIGFTLSVTHC
jgi:mucin-2